MNTTASTSRPRTLIIVAGTWILLISAITVADHVQFSRSINDRPASVDPARVARLERRVAALQGTVTALEHQPVPVRAAAYQAGEQAQNAQLSQIEDSLTDVVHTAGLTSLTRHVNQLRVEVWRLRHPLPPHPQSLADARERIPSVSHRRIGEPPPFEVLGTELRGGEEFLAVAPRDAHSLSQARVLRAGESDGDWTLESIEGRTAVFKRGEQLRRMAIP